MTAPWALCRVLGADLPCETASKGYGMPRVSLKVAKERPEALVEAVLLESHGTGVQNVGPSPCTPGPLTSGQAPGPGVLKLRGARGEYSEQVFGGGGRGTEAMTSRAMRALPGGRKSGEAPLLQVPAANT